VTVAVAEEETAVAGMAEIAEMGIVEGTGADAGAASGAKGATAGVHHHAVVVACLRPWIRVTLATCKEEEAVAAISTNGRRSGTILVTRAFPRDPCSGAHRGATSDATSPHPPLTPERPHPVLREGGVATVTTDDLICGMTDEIPETGGTHAVTPGAGIHGATLVIVAFLLATRGAVTVIENGPGHEARNAGGVGTVREMRQIATGMVQVQVELLSVAAVWEVEAMIASAMPVTIVTHGTRMAPCLQHPQRRAEAVEHRWQCLVGAGRGWVGSGQWRSTATVNSSLLFRLVDFYSEHSARPLLYFRIPLLLEHDDVRNPVGR
jgi:hypothetical protein